MKKQFEVLESKKGFLSKKPASLEEILNCENKLGVKFADDYKTYLANYGEVIYYGHELTGIGPIKRLNVVDVTQEMRKFNPKVPREYYVVEETNIDGIVIWQNTTGEIFQSYPSGRIIKTFNSLLEYIQSD